MSKTPEQKEAARQRRLARQAKAKGKPIPSSRGVTTRRDYSVTDDLSEDIKNFDPTDYSAKGGYKRNQRHVLALIEELEMIVEKPAPEGVTHTQSGSMGAVRVHLEKAIAHAKGTGHCFDCPTHSMPKIRDAWKG